MYVDGFWFVYVFVWGILVCVFVCLGELWFVCLFGGSGFTWSLSCHGFFSSFTVHIGME